MEKIPHILIVDDDPNLIGSVSDILKVKGFEPVTAMTGESALKSIEQYHFEVALIDLRLGDMSGLVVLQGIKSRSPETECILLTGHASQNSAIEAIQLGVFGFFQKPFDMEQLLLFIQRAIEKHAATGALRKSEERYHGLFEDTPVAIWQEDFSELKKHLDALKKQGIADFREYFALHPDVVLECALLIKIVDVNSAAMRLYGAKSKQALINSSNEILSKGEEEHIYEDFIAIIEGRTSNSWEGLDETLDGRPIEINLSWSVAPGCEDDYSKVIVTTFDITERRRAERALRESEGRFHALIQNAADLIIVIDSEGVIQYASPSAERILGYKDHEFLGKKFNGWVHPEDLPLAVESLLSRRKIPGTAAGSIEVRSLHKNGTWRVIEVLGTNLLAEPSVNGIVMNIRDVTERNYAEDNLHQSEQRYRGLFEDTPIAIWEEDFSGVKEHLDSLKQQGITDFRKYFALHPDVIFECSAKIKVLDVNNSAVQMFGAESKEVLIKHTNSGQSKGEAEHNHEDFIAIAEGKTSNSWEGSDATLAGEPIEISLSWSVVPGYEDDFSKVIVTTLDITERKHAEQALRDRESSLQAVLQSTADGILAVTNENKVLYANERFSEMWLIPQSVLASKEDSILLQYILDQLIDPRSFLQKVQELYKLDMESFDTLYFKDGRVFERLSQPMLQGTNLLGRVWSFRDITERKHMEDDLRLAEEKYRNIFENSLEGIFQSTPAGRFITVNPALARMWGYDSPEDMITSVTDIANQVYITPDARAEHIRLLKEQGGNLSGFEYQAHCKDGSVIWVSENVRSVRGADGVLHYYEGTVENISTRKLAEEALRASEANLNHAQAVAHIGSWNMDVPGNILTWSAETYRIFGVAPETPLTYESFLAYIHPDDVELVNRSWLAALQGAPYDVAHRILVDGQVKWVRELAELEADTEGNVLHGLGTVQDITERKRVEDQLRQLSRAVEQSASTIVITDMAGNIEYANSQFTKTTGYSVAEALGQNPRLLKSGHTPPEEYQQMWQVLAAGREWRGEFQNKKKNGELYWESATISSILNERGEITNFLAVKEDITERKLADAALRENEERYRLLFENAPVGILSATSQGQIVEINPVALQILGSPSSEATRAINLLTFPLLVNTGFSAKFKQCFDTGLPVFAEQAYTSKWGKIVYAQYRMTPIKDASGQITLIQIILEDITERKQNEEQLRLQSSALNAAANSIMLTDITGKIKWVNPAFSKLTGYALEEALEKNPRDLIKSDKQDQAFYKQMWDTILSGNVWHGEIINRDKDGNYSIEELTITPLKDAAGVINHFIAIQQDISERKQAEKNLHEREEQYRTLVEQLPAIVFIDDVNDEGRTIYISPQIETILGFTPQQWQKESPGLWVKQVHPDDLERVHAGYMRCFQYGEPYNAEYRISASDGRMLWFYDQAVMLRNENDKPHLIHGVMYDITERKQAEEITRQQGEQLRLLYEASQRLNRTLDPNEIYQAVCDFMSTVASNDGLFISGFDPESQLITCRAYWMEGKWLDVSPFPSIPLEEEGRGTQSRVIRSGQSMLINDYQKFLKTASKIYQVDSETNKFANEVSPDKDVTRSALIVPLKNGDTVIGVIQVVSYRLNAYTENQLKLLESLALHIVSAEKNALLYTQMQVELNERRQVEESLRDREEQYRTLVEQVPAVVYIDDAATEPGRTIYISPQIENILGFTVDEWRQGDLDSWLARIHPDDSQQTLAEYLRCFKDGEPIDSEYRMIAADGRCLWIRDQAVRLGDESGKPRFIHGIMYDITQRKWADEAIHQRVVELELLYESGLAFIQLLHPKEIAQKIINLLEQKMDWHHTAIRLFDPQTKTMQLLAFNQPDLTSAEEIAAMEEQLKGSVKRSGQGLSGWVIQHGQTVRTDDLANDERYFETMPGMKSGLYVPIKLGEHVIGAISIESEKPDAFNEADERLTETLANQAASALENARLFDETTQRIMELTALHRTGQTLLAARLNPEEIYAAVHKAVAETMPCEAFVIVLDDEERGEYQAVYFFDKGERFPVRRLPHGKGLSGRIISSGETLFIHDTVETPMEATHFGSMESTRSILAVPLRRGDKIIGMLSTQSYQPRVFGEPQRVMLETIAAQLSSALDNATLYQQTQARINELETLHTISTSLRTIQTVDKALSTLLDNALVTLETTAGSMLLYDPPSNELRHIVARGWFTELAQTPIKVGEGVAGTVFASGEAYYSVEFIRDALPHASARSKIPAGWGGVCLPIRTSTEIIGVLFVSVQLPSQISSQQIKLLESLVEMAGAAVHRMRLYNETAHRAEEFASLYQTSKALSAEYNLDSLLGVIVNSAREMLNASTSGMYLYHAESQELELKMDTEPSISLGTRLQLGEGVAGKVAQTRQPLRIEDYSTWESRSPKYDNLLIHAVLEVPMLYAGELIGVLTADETGDSSRKFTEADEHLLSLFASQAAGAINSARHRADTIRYAERLEQRVLERTAEIESTRQRLDLAASAGGIGVWEIGLKEFRVFWDDRMYVIHGIEPAEFDNSLGTWMQMIYSEDLAYVQEQFQAALQNTGRFYVEHRIVHPDGSLRYISSNAIVLYDGEHIPERMIGVNMDITEQKRAENEIHLANLEMGRAMRTKDEFLANMSHELRTPLNSILGISESLEEQIVGNLNEKQLRYIGIVKESGRHLLELINDILDISKIEAGRMELELHNVSVEKLCQSSLRMVKELAQKKNLRVSFEVIGSVEVVLGDERRLKQSLVNLLSNAVKFTPSESHIGLEVCGHPQENEVTFTVWDKGVGIAKEDIQYLFKPFVQLDSGLTREYQGTGLGLALVSQMMRLHGGRIDLESEVGEGSRFTITLPWLPEQQNLRTKSTSELPRPMLRSDEKRSGKVLLVEDTEVISSLMNEYLLYKGYQVFIARNGMEGFLLAKQEIPDLILMDVMMPVMDGLESTRLIREIDLLKNTPIVALTALAMPGDRERCFAAGMTDYLSKPIRIQELADMIQKHLISKG
ncbi:MAG: PAS domain S-box protein [Anaerolineales bacterium]|nr:PAS domain S-box protein [Anaerolineales bacterium]